MHVNLHKNANAKAWSTNSFEAEEMPWNKCFLCMFFSVVRRYVSLQSFTLPILGISCFAFCLLTWGEHCFSIKVDLSLLCLDRSSVPATSQPEALRVPSKVEMKYLRVQPGQVTLMAISPHIFTRLKVTSNKMTGLHGLPPAPLGQVRYFTFTNSPHTE